MLTTITMLILVVGAFILVVVSERLPQLDTDENRHKGRRKP